MFRNECLHCLCKFCSRSRCRYPCDICFARCCHKVHPVFYCAEFQHRARRQIYFVRKKSGGVADAVKKMSVSDFMKMVGDLIDKKRD